MRRPHSAAYLGERCQPLLREPAGDFGDVEIVGLFDAGNHGQARVEHP
jgi:hypothetical protein